MRVAGVIKSIEEVFPEITIDIRAFEAMRALMGQSYDVSISIEEAVFKASNIGKKVYIDGIMRPEELDENKVYTCRIDHDNKDSTTCKLYGSWLKDIIIEDGIPYEEDFKRMMKVMRELEEQKIITKWK